MKSLKMWISTILIAASLMVVVNCGGETEVKEIVETKVPVAVDTVRYQPFQIDFHSIGRVVSENQVNLLFQSAGQVDSIWANIGDYVVKDQRLASIETDVYATMYAQAKSMYEKSKRDLESSKALFNSNVISSDQFEMARIGLDNARAGYTQAKNSMDNTILRAPFSGWIVAKNLNIGDLVAPGGAMLPPMVLADMNHLKIIVPIPEARIGQIRNGQFAQIQFKTFPDRVFEGAVLRIGMAPKNMSNNYDVEVRMSGNMRGMKLGLVGDVRIVQEYFEEALVVPLNLIQDDGDNKFIYVEEEGRAVQKVIKIRALSGSQVFIEAAVVPGDVLIVKGHNDVKDGVLLDIVE
ncbi:MAG: efflux RND transporter periplasmic adaptor subunit [Candidatus Marinimicrobia bacterium]|jgi:membrane fusion protein, multidrug efflux system|nr:efflux RND transporter periplasmic adaptor subunit [Candidatus Neomarinimicrobiota bacterium]MBT3629891.1 efflux RND transporter periplasmic adaptor subunit [Candidatus Neomarinimicrobiota bacterium]MBT3824473.1 efflux RND transporter periplasmic adaptor subunit [Candidatus Neomarinimicrobiota bacterium]MBT4132752.1 efflux RND transporter periplasmic adaptor subunit [Candidatus Neomarinimicrobiota bacterium]MBT4295343.1 efflux RND transporter periplasmic adaptor subunit [Candidatus Neomarini